METLRTMWSFGNIPTVASKSTQLVLVWVWVCLDWTGAPKTTRQHRHGALAVEIFFRWIGPFENFLKTARDKVYVEWAVAMLIPYYHHQRTFCLVD